LKVVTQVFFKQELDHFATGVPTKIFALLGREV